MVRDTLVDTLGGADGLCSPHPFLPLQSYAEQNDRDRHRQRAKHL